MTNRPKSPTEQAGEVHTVDAETPFSLDDVVQQLNRVLGLLESIEDHNGKMSVQEPLPKARVILRGLIGHLGSAAVGEHSDLQRRLFDECVTANWDPERKNTFAEEIAHLHEELSEAFRAWRRYKDCEIREVNGKLEGVPIEFADALIGMFYNAELHGFNLLEAVERKHQFNLSRNYVAEGRQLHAAATPTSTQT